MASRDDNVIIEDEPTPEELARLREKFVQPLDGVAPAPPPAEEERES